MTLLRNISAGGHSCKVVLRYCASSPLVACRSDKLPQPGRQAAGEPAKAAAPAADRWESAVAVFEAADKKSPPPKDAVLFVGSSSIRLWDLEKSFPDLATINRGFGGSQMSDAVRYARG